MHTQTPTCDHDPIIELYLKFDVTVGGEIEDGDHDEGKVDPEVISKHNSKCVLFASVVIYLQCTPTRSSMG